MAPKVGSVIVVRGKPCKVVKVWPLGTIDVVDLGWSAYRRARGDYFRLTGLSMAGGWEVL